MLLQCEPTSKFLEDVSRALNTCIPTPFAFTSTLLGTLSIVSWLFAQLPQIVRNHRVKSTSGLSIFFLMEWCLGDLSNLLGALLTGQATWQIIVAGYYCFVDSMLIGQWFWYEHLMNGRTSRNIWKKTLRRHLVRSGSSFRDKREAAQGTLPQCEEARIDVHPRSGDSAIAEDTPPLDPPQDQIFSAPDPRSPLASKSPARSTHGTGRRMIHRAQGQALPSSLPTTVLFISLLIVVVQAFPLSKQSSRSETDLRFTASTEAVLGTVLSWVSTCLYLGSRMPQLLKNHRRRSTAGLSLSLFMAAFFGNLFYSMSLLCNPQAWASYPPYGCGGWVNQHGSNQRDWLTSAAPFWLGAAGVLIMDAAVGVQFWHFGSRDAKGEILIVGQDGKGTSGRRWREVSGWMRGWKPSASGISSPALESSRCATPSEEEALLPSEGRDQRSGGNGPKNYQAT